MRYHKLCLSFAVVVTIWGWRMAWLMASPFVSQTSCMAKSGCFQKLLVSSPCVSSVRTCRATPPLPHFDHFFVIPGITGGQSFLGQTHTRVSCDVLKARLHIDLVLLERPHRDAARCSMSCYLLLSATFTVIYDLGGVNQAEPAAVMGLTYKPSNVTPAALRYGVQPFWAYPLQMG